MKAQPGEVSPEAARSAVGNRNRTNMKKLEHTAWKGT